MRFFNCTEPNIRFFKKLKKPSRKKFKKKEKIKNSFSPLFGCSTRCDEKKMKFNHRSSFEFRAPYM